MAPIMTVCFFTAMRVMEDLGGALPASLGRPTLALLLKRGLSSAWSKLGDTLRANYMVRWGWFGSTRFGIM